MDEAGKPVKRFTAFPGCLINMRYPYFESAARESVRAFGIELEDSAGFVCCPDPVGLRSMSSTVWLTLAGRNLALGERKGLPIAALCNGCFETLNTANRRLKTDADQRAQVNERLKEINHEFKGSLEVKHLIQVLYESAGEEGIRKAVKRPLTGLRLATHPGCHAVRPSPIVQFDSPVEPKVLDAMVRALGATVVDYPEKMLCCGLPTFNYDKEVSLGLAKSKLRALPEVDGLVVTCPSCFLQFEVAQLLNRDSAMGPVPIFYYFELLALAMGVEREKTGVDQHRVRTEDALAKLQAV